LNQAHCLDLDEVTLPRQAECQTDDLLEKHHLGRDQSNDVDTFTGSK
jgi:hypothetical protein